MGRGYVHLQLSERRKIEAWFVAGMSKAEIADRLGRSPSTIHREIKRNTYIDVELPKLNDYYAWNAQSSYEKRRAVHRKLIAYPDVKAAVEDRLKAGWSPEQIAGRMRLEEHPVSVSYETIYRYASSKEGRAEEFFRHLPRHRRQRRPRNMRRRHGQRFKSEMSILINRPDAVRERQQFGHWECDLVMFRREFGKANVTTLVERVSRFTVALKNEDRRSLPVMEQLIENLGRLPQHARRSITFDRGTEFTAYDHLKRGAGVDTWFCDPQAPWQKGTVENTNGRLRKYIPRSADPSVLTNRYLGSICKNLNTTPRKCLGFKTPEEVFRDRLMDVAK